MSSSYVDASWSVATSAPVEAMSCAWPKGLPPPKLIFQVITRKRPPPPLGDGDGEAPAPERDALEP